MEWCLLGERVEVMWIYLLYYFSDSRIWLLVLTSIGKFAVSAVFGIVYLLAAEVYPTVLRTVGLGTSSMWARVGSMIAPYVAILVSWLYLRYISRHISGETECGDGFCEASTLCLYDYLFIVSWVRRHALVSDVSDVLTACTVACIRLLIFLVLRYVVTVVVRFMFCLMSASVTFLWILICVVYL